MEKDGAAIDTVEFTDNFICRSSITRSDMLFITLGSSIFAKELPSCVSTGDQALFYTARELNYYSFFALRLLVVFIENIRDSIEAQNGSLPQSSLSKRRIFGHKDTNFWSKYTLFNKKTRFWYIIFILYLANRYAKRSKNEEYQ